MQGAGCRVQGRGMRKPDEGFWAAEARWRTGGERCKGGMKGRDSRTGRTKQVQGRGIRAGVQTHGAREGRGIRAGGAWDQVVFRVAGAEEPTAACSVSLTLGLALADSAPRDTTGSVPAVAFTVAKAVAVRLPLRAVSVKLYSVPSAVPWGNKQRFKQRLRKGSVSGSRRFQIAARKGVQIAAEKRLKLRPAAAAAAAAAAAMPSWEWGRVDAPAAAGAPAWEGAGAATMWPLVLSALVLPAVATSGWLLLLGEPT